MQRPRSVQWLTREKPPVPQCDSCGTIGAAIVRTVGDYRFCADCDALLGEIGEQTMLQEIEPPPTASDLFWDRVDEDFDREREER